MMTYAMFVLPLGIIVAVLVASVYYYANKEAIARRKTKKLVQAYIKEKAKQKEAMNKELANINKLFENKSIDKETCARLKNVLIMMNEKKREETMDILKYVANNNRTSEFTPDHFRKPKQLFSLRSNYTLNSAG
jgi:hypothetical protein